VQASAHVRRVGEGGEGAPRCGGRSQRTGPMPALLYGWAGGQVSDEAIDERTARPLTYT
jgi:hypothetical protein